MEIGSTSHSASRPLPPTGGREILDLMKELLPALGHQSLLSVPHVILLKGRAEEVHTAVPQEGNVAFHFMRLGIKSVAESGNKLFSMRLEGCTGLFSIPDLSGDTKQERVTASAFIGLM